jgi:hypothetical protein
VQADDVDDDAVEPPVPRGLLDMPASLQALVEFLRIDDDLLDAAAEASAAEPDDAKELRAWVACMSAKAKDDWLRRAVDEPELAVGVELRRAFRKQSKAEAPHRRRTARELRAAAEVRRERREHAEAARAEKARKAMAAARTKRLDALATKLDAAWTELESLVGRSAHDDAIKLTIDLRDLAKRDGAESGFADRFAALRKRQPQRRTFFKRWKRENQPRRW